MTKTVERKRYQQQSFRVDDICGAKEWVETRLGVVGEFSLRDGYISFIAVRGKFITANIGDYIVWSETSEGITFSKYTKNQYNFFFEERV